MKPKKSSTKPWQHAVPGLFLVLFMSVAGSGMGIGATAYAASPGGSRIHSARSRLLLSTSTSRSANPSHHPESVSVRLQLWHLGSLGPRPQSPRPVHFRTLASISQSAPQDSCASGNWLGFPYLNRFYFADQGCTSQGIGAGTATLGSAGCPNTCLPLNMVLDTTHCDNTTYQGQCVYYMENSLTIPSGGSLTVDSGVTLIMDDDYCGQPNTAGYGCPGSDFLYVQSGGTLTAQPGAAIELANGQPSTGTDPGIDVTGGTVNMIGSGSAQGQSITLTSFNSLPQPGDWLGIRFENGGTGTLEYVDLAYAGQQWNYGGVNKAAAINTNGTSPTIENSVIDHSYGYGIEIDPNGGAPTLTNDSLTNNGVSPVTPSGWYGPPTYAVYYDNTPADMTGLSGLTASGNGNNAVAMSGGTDGGTGTWQNPDVPGANLPIVLGIAGRNQAGNVDIGSFQYCCQNGNLTIAAGTLIESAGYQFRIAGSGSSVAMNGTATNPITMTSANGVPKAGDWGGIAHDDESSSSLAMNFVHLSYALEGLYVDGNGGGTNSISNSTVSNSSGNGIEFNNVNHSITLSGDTFTGNAGWPIFLDSPQTDLSGLSGLSATGNGHNAIGITSAGYSGTGTWPNAGIPYVVGAQGGSPTPTLDIGSFHYCCSNGNLTITAGATVEFNGDQLRIAGGSSVTMNGTPTTPITLTSDNSSPQPGDWAGIADDDESGNSLTMNSVNVSYAATGVYVNGNGGGGLSISNSTFSHESGNDFESSLPATLTYDSFLSVPSGNYGVKNDGGSTLIATHNWWGDSSGPNDPVGNPNGKGTLVSSGVAYSPWLGLTIAPSTAPAGSAARVSGTGFASNEKVTVKWNCAANPCQGSTVLATFTTNSSGAFNNLSVTIPAGAHLGGHSLASIGSKSGGLATAGFTVTSGPPPTITLNPTSGPFKTSVTVSGSGFVANETVKVYWTTTNSNAVATVTASSTGGFSATFNAPASPLGSHTVYAVGQTGQYVADTPFQTVSSTALLHNSGTSGSSNQLTAYGFQTGETVIATWGSGTGTTLGSAVAGPNGTAVIPFTVPTATAGTYSVYATGGTSKASAFSTFTLH